MLVLWCLMFTTPVQVLLAEIEGDVGVEGQGCYSVEWHTASVSHSALPYFASGGLDLQLPNYFHDVLLTHVHGVVMLLDQLT